MIHRDGRDGSDGRDEEKNLTTKITNAATRQHKDHKIKFFIKKENIKTDSDHNEKLKKYKN